MLARGVQGRALGNLDDFDKRDLSDVSEDEDENVRRDDTSRYHFGGGFEAAEEVSEERRKSKAEVMAEIIAKSKMYKAERRRDVAGTYAKRWAASRPWRNSTGSWPRLR